MATQKTPLSGAERMAQVEQAVEEFGGRLNALSLDNARAQGKITALETLVRGLAVALTLNSSYDRWEAAERTMKQYETDMAN